MAKTFSTSERSRKIAEAISRFEAACRADETRGAQPVEDMALIRQEYNDAQLNLMLVLSHYLPKT